MPLAPPCWTMNTIMLVWWTRVLAAEAELRTLAAADLQTWRPKSLSWGIKGNLAGENPGVAWFSFLRSSTPITVAHGDGIGPEIMAATLRILQKSGIPLDVETIELG